MQRFMVFVALVYSIYWYVSKLIGTLSDGLFPVDEITIAAAVYATYLIFRYSDRRAV